MNVLMFLDPPYFEVKQNSHYRHPFTKYDHIRLNSLLKVSNHSFFLTYDDNPKIIVYYT